MRGNTAAYVWSPWYLGRLGRREEQPVEGWKNKVSWVPNQGTFWLSHMQGPQSQPWRWVLASLLPAQHAWKGPVCGAYLSGSALVGAVLQQVLHDLNVVLLGSHVQGCEAVLGT